MNTQEKMNRVIEIANEKYDGHFTLMKFTTNWRFIFGTIIDCEEINYMHSGNTIDEVLDKAFENPICIYDFFE